MLIRGVGLRNFLIEGFVRNVLNMFLLSVQHTIPTHQFLGYLKQILALEAFKPFNITASFSIKLCFVQGKNIVC